MAQTSKAWRLGTFTNIRRMSDTLSEVTAERDSYLPCIAWRSGDGKSAYSLARVFGESISASVEKADVSMSDAAVMYGVSRRTLQRRAAMFLMVAGASGEELWGGVVDGEWLG